MPAHQATATAPPLPIGVPSSRPRIVSMIGVNGWCSANQRTAAGIESVGTNPLLRNGSSWTMSRNGVVPADRLGGQAERDRQPGQREREQREEAGRGEPVDGVAVGPEAHQHRDAHDQHRADQRLGHGPTTCPVSTDARAIAMVRNRAMMPSVMSW